MSDKLAERIDRAFNMISALCTPRGSPGAREWIMSIPARPDHDPDLVIGDGLMAGRDALAELERAREALVTKEGRLVDAHELIDGVGRMDDWRKRAEKWLAEGLQ